MGPEFFQGFTLLALLGVLGTAGRFAWVNLTGRIDKRSSDLDAREKAFEDKRDSRISVLEADVKRLSDRYQMLSDIVGRQRTAIHLLVAKILKDDPGAPELVLVEKLLGDEFPALMRVDDEHVGVPKNLKDLATKLDGKDDDNGC